MNRDAEAALLVGISVVAALGVALVNLAQGGNVDAQVALTFIVFLAALGGVHVSVRRWAPDASPFLLPLAGVLTTIGFVEVYRIDAQLGGLQRWWLLIASGLAVGLLALLRGPGVSVFRRYRYLLLVTAVLLLLMPMLPTAGLPLRGVVAGGSRLWVAFELGPVAIHFQPGEIAKLLLVIFLASYLGERQAVLAHSTRKIGRWSMPEPRHLLPIVIAWLLSFAILVVQRDLGASLLLFATFIAMLYAATGRASYVTSGTGLFFAGALIAAASFDHVQRRVTAWLHPFDDPQGAGYQILQSLFALASGSLSGAGLGVGTPGRIPAASTDFIFSAVGEELGLAGTVAVLATYALLIAVGFGIAIRSREPFRKLLAAGLTFVLGFQAFLIIAGVTRVLPLTGITLPFMSYGGSSLVANFLLLAILLRISHEEHTV